MNLSDRRAMARSLTVTLDPIRSLGVWLWKVVADQLEIASRRPCSKADVYAVFVGRWFYCLAEKPKIMNSSVGMI